MTTGPINARPTHRDRRNQSFCDLMRSELKQGRISEAAHYANLLLENIDRGDPPPSAFAGKADACSILRFVKGLDSDD